MIFTHIINPVKVGESSDLFVAQPVTFESMKRAKAFASNTVDVNLVTTQYKEDHSIIPSYFNKTKDLERSILDFGTFNKKRKLPLIKDILQRAVDYNANSDYIIYTNADIALMPNFYMFVTQQIEAGFDAFVINRRTITNAYSKPEQLPLMYAEIGTSHPGYDCFVFKKELFDKFILGDICIGTTRIGLAVISNLILFSNKFCVFKKTHLSFHIGEDRVWQDDSLLDYVKHNEKEAISILSKLKKININKFENNKILSKYYKILIEKDVEVKPSKPYSLLKRILKK